MFRKVGTLTRGTSKVYVTVGLGHYLKDRFMPASFSCDLPGFTSVSKFR
jgi:hypothetical protein